MNNITDDSATSPQPKPFKIKIVRISGLTKNQRDLELKKVMKSLVHQGWVFINHDETSGIKGAIDGSAAEFYRMSKPNFQQAIFDWYFERKLKIWLSTFGFMFIFGFIGLSQLAQKSNEEYQVKNVLSEQQYALERKQKIQMANTAAESLKNFLRNNGVNESLVIDVKADEFGTIVLVVSNSWLERPKYEQKQMKQTIELALKKIARPDGWPFYLTDFMGNRI